MRRPLLSPNLSDALTESGQLAGLHPILFEGHQHLLGLLVHVVADVGAGRAADAEEPAGHLLPGSDMFEDPGAGCTDFRGSTIIPGVGHWVQQEAPAETNAALDAFLATLS